MPLAGQVAVVAGASKRLGRCYALSLARAGARVAALARTLGSDPHRMGSLREVETTAQKEGLDLTAMQCDLADEKSVREAIERVTDRFGRIDCVVNNAVQFSSRRECRGIAAADWNLAFAVNVRAPYLLADAAISVMQAGGGGSIVNITSLSAGKTGKGGGAHKGAAALWPDQGGAQPADDLACRRTRRPKHRGQCDRPRRRQPLYGAGQRPARRYAQ